MQFLSNVCLFTKIFYTHVIFFKYFIKIVVIGPFFECLMHHGKQYVILLHLSTINFILYFISDEKSQNPSFLYLYATNLRKVYYKDNIFLYSKLDSCYRELLAYEGGCSISTDVLIIELLLFSDTFIKGCECALYFMEVAENRLGKMSIEYGCSLGSILETIVCHEWFKIKFNEKKFK